MSGTRVLLEPITVVRGTAFRKLNSVTLNSSRTVVRNELTDVVPAAKDKYFLVSKLSIKGGIANGDNSGARYNNWPVEGINGMSLNHLSFPDQLSDSAYATKVSADTNPSEPIVDVGQTFAELREVPQQLKRRGLDVYATFVKGRMNKKRRLWLLTGAGADLNLRFNFEINPIARDLASLLYIKRKLKNKIRELLQAEKKGGLVRKRDVYSSTALSVQKNVLLVSNLGTANQWRADIETTTTTHVWVYCRWVPDSTRRLSYMNDKRFHGAFASRMLGMDLSNFRNIWNALPWSWLTDWCFNVGEYLSATNNTVGLRLAAVCVCQTTRTEQRFRFTDIPSGVKVDECVKTLITKSRRPASLEIFPTLPLLSKRQVSILASIVRQRV